MYEHRPEQEEWKDACADAFLEHNYVLGQASCGFGKSSIFARIAKARVDAGSRVLIVAPQSEIVDQISNRMLEAGVVHGFQSGGYPEIPEANAQIGTPLSILSNIRKKGWKGHYDLVIEDECHRAVSKTYLDLHEELYRQNPHHYRFGVTATPVRMDNKPMRASYDHMVCAPPTSKLVELGRLVPLKVNSPPCGVDFSGIRNPDSAIEKQAALLNTKQFHDTVFGAIEKRGVDLQTLIFGTTIKHCYDVQKELKLAGIESAVLEGSLSRAERKNIVDDYRKGLLRFLLTCQLGITGFDVPRVQHGIWARRTMSLTNWIQGNGRVQRPEPEILKMLGYISDLCGNVYKCGSPDIDREWSIEGGVMVPKGLHLVRQCPKCYAWITNGSKICDECNIEIPVKQPKFSYAKNGELVEVKDIKPKQKSQKMVDFKTEERLIDVRDPRAYEKYCELCERYGYKKAFGAMRLKMRRTYKGRKKA